MVGASNAFNQIIEKDTDALMKRTMNRPLPTAECTFPWLWLSRFPLPFWAWRFYTASIRKCFVRRHFHIFIHSVYTPLKSITPLAFCWRDTGCHSVYVGLGCCNRRFFDWTGNLVFNSIFLAIPPFWAIAWLQYDEYKKPDLIWCRWDKK